MVKKTKRLIAQKYAQKHHLEGWQSLVECTRLEIERRLDRCPGVRIPHLPPLVNNTNPETKTEFVLFFSNEYFGIKIDLKGKKKNQPGV
jgi:hypothetical protein